MTETAESGAEPTAAGQTRYDDQHERPRRLGQVLAWVGIIAGVVFVVAVIFFSGLLLGWSSGGHHGWHRGYGGDRDDCSAGQMSPGQMGQDGMMGPGQMGPGMMGPGQMGPGGSMPPQPSPTTTPPRLPRI